MSMIKRTLILVFVSFICLSLYLYWGNRQIGNRTPEHKKPNITSIEKNIINKNDLKKTNQQRTEHTDIRKNSAITFVNEFDNDPVIEHQALQRRHKICIEYYAYKEISITGKRAPFKTKQQQDFYLQATKNCEKLNKTHPEYDLTATTKQRLAKNKLTGTTRFGMLLEPNKVEYTEEETLFIFKTIAHKYPSLINSPVLYKTLQYKIDKMIPEVMQIIQTTQVNYASRIIFDSENYLSCQLGADCSNQSSMMYYYCLSEPNFCINNFDELFNTRLPNAVKADISLALPYIKSIYQVD